jgi:hypothetical protein
VTPSRRSILSLLESSNGPNLSVLCTMASLEQPGIATSILYSAL